VLGFFLLATASRPALGPTQPLPGVERPGCEADHCPPSNVETEKEWSYTSTSI